MTDIFHDLIDCELEFKQAYFGIKNQEQTFHSQERARLSRSPIAYSVSSMTKSSTSEKVKLHDYIECEDREDQREE